MPSNRSRRVRKQNDLIQLDQSIEDFLFSGVTRTGTIADEHFRDHIFDDVLDKVKIVWMKYRDELLKKWKNEGRGRSWAEEEFERYAH